MNLVSLANSRLGPPLGILLTSVLPRQAAYRLAERMAQATARQSQAPIVQAIRANQAVVRGLAYNDPDLDAAVEAVLDNAARGYVDLFRAIAGGRNAVMSSCVLEESLVDGLRRAEASGRGLVAVGGHMSCFDMLLLSLAARGYRPQALSFADPQGSYRIQNAIRIRYGLDLTPISPPALRSALRKLRGGGLVLTGVDRPHPQGEELVFFGRKARMPLGHARLAIRTGSQLLVGIVRSSGDATYSVTGLDLIDPRDLGAGGQDPRLLAQTVLSVIEGFVRQRPEEWLMFLPVWPEMLPD